MANLLAEETLDAILSFALAIPESLFKTPLMLLSDKPPPFINRSSSLFVSKRWLRVGSPHLYKYVFIHSSEQVLSLLAALRAHPGLGTYVKYLRIHGSFPGLGPVLRACSALHTLALCLDIPSRSPVAGLIRSLSFINPEEVHLFDSKMWKNQNRRQLRFGLARALPEWTNLVSIHLPDSWTWWIRDGPVTREAAAETLGLPSEDPIDGPCFLTRTRSSTDIQEIVDVIRTGRVPVKLLGLPCVTQTIITTVDNEVYRLASAASPGPGDFHVFMYVEDCWVTPDSTADDLTIWGIGTGSGTAVWDWE